MPLEGKPVVVSGTRQFPRVDFFNPVQVVDTDKKLSLRFFASNISCGGIFLRSNKPLPKGKRFCLEFVTDQGPIRIEEGEVVWNKQFEPINIDGQVPGMGLHFRKISSESHEKISNFVDKILTQQKPTKSTVGDSGLEEPEVDSCDDHDIRDELLNTFKVSTANQPKQSRKKIIDSFLDDLMQDESNVGSAGLDNPNALTTDGPRGCPDAGAERSNLPKVPVAKIHTIQENIKRQSALSTQTIDDYNCEGDAALVSFPPHPRTRVLLFGVFVMAVAVITFFSLLIIQPLNGDENPEPVGQISTTSINSHQLNQQQIQAPVPSTDSLTSPVTNLSRSPEQPQPESTQAPSEPNPKTRATEEPRDSPEVLSDSTPALEVGVLGLPTFEETARDWKIKIRLGDGIKVKSFTLPQPQRLVLDFHSASFSSEQRTLTSSLPFIDKIRVGIQPEIVRLVVDFKSPQVPAYQVLTGKNEVSIVFGK